MNRQKVNETYKRWTAAICGKQILLSRDSSKLCFGLPGMLQATQSHLLRLRAGGGLLQSRKPYKQSINQPIYVQ